MEINRSWQYPIGTVEEQRYAHLPFGETLKEELLTEIKFLPSALEYSLLNLDEAQLNEPYRPGGWTVSQLVHQIADSHINAYVRCKLTLTEDTPTIKPYDQDAWAGLIDYKLPVNISTTLLHSLHLRWHALLTHLPAEAWARSFYHPEQKKNVTLWEVLKYYAWHGRHHVSQILKLRERNDW